MNCPIKLEISEAEESGKKFVKAMRRLRRAIVLCDKCQAVDGCEIRKQFNLTVDSVIAEVNEEWDLLGTRS